MRVLHSSSLIVGFTVILVLAMGGCTSSTSVTSPSLPAMWKADFDQALADSSLSDFQRQILSDDVITDSEYHEAQDHFQQCMADQGWSVTFNQDNDGQSDQGSYSMAALNGRAWDADAASASASTCSKDSTSWVDTIYWGMKDNPQGLTQAQLIRACFQAHNVPDGSGLSDDQFSQMLDDLSYHASTPEGVLCVYDPTGSLGMTVEQAEVADSTPKTRYQGNPDGSVTVVQADGSSTTIPASSSPSGG